jgi:translation initiation factor IF-1
MSRADRKAMPMPITEYYNELQRREGLEPVQLVAEWAHSATERQATTGNAASNSHLYIVEPGRSSTTVLPGTMFRVALANDHLVLAQISGKMRKRFIRLTIGDRVKMERSSYDTTKARIVYRF